MWDRFYRKPLKLGSYDETRIGTAPGSVGRRTTTRIPFLGRNVIDGTSSIRCSGTSSSRCRATIVARIRIASIIAN